MLKYLRVFLPVALSLGVVWGATAPAPIPPSAVLSWTAPTTYSDTTPLPVAQIDHYTVSWSRISGGAVLGSLTVNGLTASVPVVCGVMYFSVTATSTTSAVYPSATSLPAGPVSFDSGVPCTPTPNPPGALAAHH